MRTAPRRHLEECCRSPGRERSQARAPGDIDVVTFAMTPQGMSPAQVEALPQMYPDLFDLNRAKARYGCDAYLLRLDGSPGRLVRRAAYYFGLFSHRIRQRLEGVASHATSVG